MTVPAWLTTYGALLLAGLAGSLHCIGMCGPILLGFTQAMRQHAPGGDNGQGNGQGNDQGEGKGRPLVREMALYHAGRIWTYGLLGLVAGLVGHGVRHGSALAGWHRIAGAAIGVVVVVIGVALLGVIPGLRLNAPSGCGIKQLGAHAWLRALLSQRGVLPRLLLGATMGFLPCGLVYAMLAVVATLPTPLHAALGMVVFGLGTLPSLSAVLITSHVLPAAWRAHGMRLAALLVIATGLWMGVRALVVHEHSHDAGAPAPAAMLGVDHSGHNR